MKQIKFASHLVPLILSGDKTSTWRLWDDKDLKTGDIVKLVKRPELTVFAKAKLISVVEKTMSQITEEDKKVMKMWVKLKRKCIKFILVIMAKK